MIEGFNAALIILTIKLNEFSIVYLRMLYFEKLINFRQIYLRKIVITVSGSTVLRISA